MSGTGREAQHAMHRPFAALTSVYRWVAVHRSKLPTDGNEGPAKGIMLRLMTGASYLDLYYAYGSRAALSTTFLLKQETCYCDP